MIAIGINSVATVNQKAGTPDSLTHSACVFTWYTYLRVAVL